MRTISTCPEGESLPKRILITGAGGFTGLHACHYFSEIGYSVFALSRKPFSITCDNLTNIVCDLTDYHSLSNCISSIKPDYILHLAGRNSVPESWKDPLKTIETNVMCTANLLHAILNSHKNCRTIVVGSILQPPSFDASAFQHPYGLSKTLQTLLSEAYSFLFELDIMIAKPTNLIGPGESTGICSILAEKVVRMELGMDEKKLTINNLLVERDFLDVRDAVRAYDCLFLNGTTRGVYEVTTGHLRSLNEVLACLRDFAKIDFDVSTDLEKRESPQLIIPQRLLKIGWLPAIPFEQSIKDVVDYYRKKCQNTEKC